MEHVITNWQVVRNYGKVFDIALIKEKCRMFVLLIKVWFIACTSTQHCINKYYIRYDVLKILLIIVKISKNYYCEYTEYNILSMDIWLDNINIESEI